MSKSKQHHQGPSGNAKAGQQGGKEFEFKQEDYPAIPRKPSAQVSVSHSKAESGKDATVSTTPSSISFSISKIETTSLDPKAGEFKPAFIGTSLDPKAGEFKFVELGSSGAKDKQISR